MITAGPTYEKIDPVRFIGNYSSGKMGIALAGRMCPSWGRGDVDRRTGATENAAFAYPPNRCGICSESV